MITLPKIPIRFVSPDCVVMTIRLWKFLRNTSSTSVLNPPHEESVTTKPVLAELSEKHFSVKYQLTGEELVRVKTVEAPNHIEAFRHVVNEHCDNGEILRSMISIREVSRNG